MNNSLLYNPEYVRTVKNTILRTTCQYSVVNGDPNFFVNASKDELEGFYASQSPESLQTQNLTINPELYLETLLMEIRRVTISFSAKMKRERCKKEKDLIMEIGTMETDAHINDLEPLAIVELNKKKAALEELIQYQTQGAYVRARAKYKLEGEKPTKFFCSLEKYNSIQKYVPQLLVEDEDRNTNLLTDQDKIESEITSFYKRLFTNNDTCVEIESIEEFLGEDICESIPKLTDNEKNKMKGHLTLTELTDYLKRCKNNVSPGSTGFTNDFYKFFWRDIKFFVINAVNFAFDQHRLPLSQRMGIISIIPKGDKDKRYLTNWRPITLLNTLYKLISGCIAERIKPALINIIHPDQKGFVAGRFIGEAIRTT